MEELITIEAFAHTAVDQEKLRSIEQELAAFQQENVLAILFNRNVLNLFLLMLS